VRLRPIAIALLVALASVAATAGRAASNPSIGPYRVETVAEGVFAVVPEEPLREPVDGNSLFIVTGEGVLVLDTNLLPAKSAAVIGEIRKRTDQPVRWVVYSHWHDDHIFGSGEYRKAFPNAVFLSHENTRTDMEASALPVLKEAPAALKRAEERLAKGVKSNGEPMTDAEKTAFAARIEEYRGFVRQMSTADPVLPGVTLREVVTLRAGGREIQLRHFGRGNTRGDLVVWLPKERVLATGDLLVAPTPFGIGSFFGDWITTLGKLEALEPAVIVPGHGPVMRDREYLQRVRRLLESTLSQAKAAAAKGLSLEETRKAVDLEEFRRLFAAEDKSKNDAFREYFVEPGVERAYREATGTLDEAAERYKGGG
jgi:glyoxylase-like metal-dependent hydrolase (beta-lactamase superfamily II)